MGAKKAQASTSPTADTSAAVAGEVSRPVPRNAQVAMLVAFVLGLWFVKPYWGAILFSALVAFTFNPVYKGTLKRTKKQGIAMLVTLLAAFLSVIVPIAIVVGVTANEASTLVARFQDGNLNVGSAQIEEIVDRGTDRVNDIIHGLPGGKNVDIEKGKVIDTLKNAGQDILQGLINFVKHAGGAALGLISTSILVLFMVMSMWRYQDKLLELVQKISPFHRSVTDLYLARTSAMTKAMVKGQLIIAVAQGFASAASLWLAGLDYFWFFVVILTFLSFIPLGGGIITIPVGLILMFTGNISWGVFIILFHVLAVSNIDNLLRPRLVPKSAQLNSALVLLSVFSGLAIFGMAGVVYGPVIMILLVTTFKMYAEYNHRNEKPLPPKNL